MNESPRRLLISLSPCLAVLLVVQTRRACVKCVVYACCCRLSPMFFIFICIIWAFFSFAMRIKWRSVLLARAAERQLNAGARCAVVFTRQPHAHVCVRLHSHIHLTGLLSQYCRSLFDFM